MSEFEKLYTVPKGSHFDANLNMYVPDEPMTNPWEEIHQQNRFWKVWQSAKQSMQGEAVGTVGHDFETGNPYVNWNVNTNQIAGASLYTNAPDSAKTIAELQAQVDGLLSELNELGNAYILMRGALNYLTDKAITGNQADEALGSKIPNAMARFPMSEMSGSWENLMTLYVDRDAAIKGGCGVKYPMRPNQTIEYNTLHAIENGATQALWVGVQLRRAGIEYKPNQIYGAMQRLRKDGVIERVGGLWRLRAEPDAAIKGGE